MCGSPTCDLLPNNYGWHLLSDDHDTTSRRAIEHNVRTVARIPTEVTENLPKIKSPTTSVCGSSTHKGTRILLLWYVFPVHIRGTFPPFS